MRGVAIFAKACFGHPSPSKRQKLNATAANAFGAPIRPRHLVPTQQGVGTLAPNGLTPCRMAFYFVSTFAIAQTPTKQPALRLSRTKNLHFAKATFPGFSAAEVSIFSSNVAPSDNSSSTTRLFAVDAKKTALVRFNSVPKRPSPSSNWLISGA